MIIAKLKSIVNLTKGIIKGNRIVCSDMNIFFQLFRIDWIIRGKNNKVIFRKGAKISGSIIIIGDSNYIEIGEKCNINNGCLRTDGINNKIIIGERVYLGKNAHFYAGDSSRIMIGKDCMFSSEVDVQSCDGHNIYYKGNLRKSINRANNITVGNHVWIGKRVTLLKGAMISEGSIIGTRALINKKYDEKNVVIVGNPARIIKHGVVWKY